MLHRSYAATERERPSLIQPLMFLLHHDLHSATARARARAIPHSLAASECGGGGGSLASRHYTNATCERGARGGANDGVEDSYDLQVGGHFIMWLIGRSQAEVHQEGPES